MSRRSPALARRRIEPTWLSHPLYVETFGPEVCDIGAEAGLIADPEQELFLNLLFAIDGAGKSIAFQNALIGPRQIFGKTATVQMAELGWFFVTEEKYFVHSAHELDTTEKSFNELYDLISNSSALAAYLDPGKGKPESPGLISNNNTWSIYVRGSAGQQLHLKFKARTKAGMRGLTANKLVLDEAFSLSSANVGSIYPTLTTLTDPQILLASSAGMLSSTFLRSVRDEGRANEVGTSSRLVWVEYADDPERYGRCKSPTCTHAKPPNNPPGCALDDERRWKRFMTSLGTRTSIQTIRDMRRSMPPEEFAREFMGWWDAPPVIAGGGVLDLDKWEALADESAPALTAGTVTLDVSPDRSASTIAVAGDAPDGRTLIVTNTLPGTAKTVPALLALAERIKITGPVRLQAGAQAAVLIPALDEARITWEPITLTELGQATAAFIVAVNETSSVVHVSQPEFTAAIANAVTRTYGEAELWNRKDKSVDIGPVVAGSTALHYWLTRPPGAPPAALAIPADEPSGESLGWIDWNSVPL